MHRLLGILDFFAEWRLAVDKDEKCDENNFLAKETWNGLQRMILGYVCMVHYYVVEAKCTIKPKNTTSDKCEHYFSRVRGSFGGSNQAGAMAWHEARRNDNIRDSNGFVPMTNQKGNAGSDPELPVNCRKKRKKY